MKQFISIRGAREHNLKNINLDIPRNELVVITGLSGSGKSSLAFDTIYAEGQRRYVESLSAYARQFLQLMPKPDVDTIEGLSPAISIEQKTTSKNPRSTVGTITEIYDYLRLLYARIGVPHSPYTNLPIESQTVSQMVDKILTFAPKTKIIILAPIVRGRKGEYKKELQDLQKKGFQRVKIDGEIYDLDNVPALNKKVNHDICVVVDRLVISDSIEDMQARLADSIETTLKLSDGLVWVEDLSTSKINKFSSKFACQESGFTLEEVEPRLFSFNSPFGACPTCDGLGIEVEFDENLIVPDKSLSIRDGAIVPWSDDTFFNSKRSRISRDYYAQILDSIVRHYKHSSTDPFADLPEYLQNIILHGSGEEVIPVAFDDGYRNYITKKTFEGVIPNLKRRWQETENDLIREFLSKFQNENKCSSCNGYRLKKEALCVKIGGKHVGEICDFSIKELLNWFENLSLSERQNSIGDKILKEIKSRLSFLLDVGLNYLNLSRASGTLSGGESQRIRLASQVGSALTGVLYVLDEPSIGLHQRDNDRLLNTLKNLKELGNTVIVVEHDEDAIKAGDYIIDMGFGAGVHGGEVVAQGSLQNILASTTSLTAKYLTGEKFIPIPKNRRQGTGKNISLRGANLNNLKNVDIDIPLGTMTCVTGVSGGGKSSLIIETLYKNLVKNLSRSKSCQQINCKDLKGIEYLDKVIDIDQSPIGRTPRSNPATYIGCFTPIREWFAQLPESKSRGYSAGRFSFNVKGGRCEACQGDGVTKIEMHFLPDVYVECDQCKGKRYNRETLSITYKDKNIAEILDMTVEEGVEFFKSHQSVLDKLKALTDVGLGYIKIGQQATTLSGGEAQRVKLAKELSKRATGKTVYILDEPTTGLHFEDIRKLLEVLHKLVNQGNTVIIIEHNLEVIKTADWIIDMGPEGGDAGGNVVGVGTPEDIAKIKESYTGFYLKPYVEKKYALSL
jgi:excinuclease ABC subunit A